MRKLGRMVRRVLTAVSLLLFVAVLAAWVRGYFEPGSFSVQRESLQHDHWRRARMGVEWGRNGKLYFDFLMTGTADSMAVSYREGFHAGNEMYGVRWTLHRTVSELFVKEFDLRSWPNVEKRDWQGCGLGIYHIEWHGGADTQDGNLLFHSCDQHLVGYIFPCWMAAIVFGALPSWRGFVWWRGVRRRRLASRAGRCPVCGYDLRASPGRCPECGTAVEARETRGGGAV